MSRSRWFSLLLLTLLVSSDVHAQVKAAATARIRLLNKKAMDEYDTLEFEAARAALVEAVGVARSAGITGGDALTTTYLDLGIVYGAGLNDRINAIKYFSAAMRINRNAVLNPSRATPALEEMFNSAKQNLPVSPPPTGPAFRHNPVDDAVVGRTVRIRVHVADPSAERVVLYFRTVGASDFRQVPMQEVKSGSYVGVVPAQLVRGRSIYYYVEAQNAAGERLHGHGTATSPNIISVRPAGVQPPPPPQQQQQQRSGKVFSIGLMVGAGLGIVNGGESEHEQPQAAGGAKTVDINPGGALAPFHIAPELSYHLNDNWHLCVLGRIQVINATTESSKVSLLGEARAKRFFGEGALRFYMAFGAGAGQMRHRIPLGDYDSLASTPDDRVDSRVAGIGAFGLGGGISYMFSSYVGLALEINGLIMVPAFAANLDLNTGLLLSF